MKELNESEVKLVSGAKCTPNGAGNAAVGGFVAGAIGGAFGGLGGIDLLPNSVQS